MLTLFAMTMSLNSWAESWANIHGREIDDLNERVANLLHRVTELEEKLKLVEGVHHEDEISAGLDLSGTYQASNETGESTLSIRLEATETPGIYKSAGAGVSQFHVKKMGSGAIVLSTEGGDVELRFIESDQFRVANHRGYGSYDVEPEVYERDSAR